VRLRDEGRLDLADPLDRHLDAPGAADVTIAQPLSHTAGLASQTPGPWRERTPGDLRPELADLIGPRQPYGPGAPLAAQPDPDGRQTSDV
jgi:CubicO group peptidase (beta-lactamase class C family)